MKKNFLALAAIVIAIGAAAFTAEKKQPVPSGDFAPFYYRFTGAPGQAGDVSKWEQITKGAYDSMSCLSNVKPCKITNTTNSAGHPTSVPLSGTLPQQGAINTEVLNQP